MSAAIWLLYQIFCQSNKFFYLKSVSSFPTSVCHETFQNFCCCNVILISLPHKVYHEGKLEDRNFINFITLYFACMVQYAGGEQYLNNSFFTSPKLCKQLEIMELASTFNLVSSETKKTLTASNFQNMNSFVMSHDLVRGQIGRHANERLFIRSFTMAEL